MKKEYETHFLEKKTQEMKVENFENNVLETPKKRKKKTSKLSLGKKILLLFILFFAFGIGCLAFLFYGPWEGFRNFWITSAMTTLSHQYLATMLYKIKLLKLKVKVIRI